MAISRIKPASRGVPGSARRVADRASHGLYSLFEAPSRLLKEGQELRVAAEQVPLAAAAGSALLYIEGQERAKSAGDSSLWLKMLAEAGIIYGLMAHTSGVLPLLGLGTLAWKMGQADGDSGKLKNAMNVGGAMTLGYVGAILGLRYTLAATDREVRNMLPLLRDSQVRAFFSSQNDAPAPWRQTLAQTGRQLDESVPALERSLSFLNADPVTAQAHRKKLLQELEKMQAPLQDEAFNRYLSGLAQEASESLAKSPADPAWQAHQKLIRRVRELTTRLADSQMAGYRFIRAANPVFGTLIGMMAGAKVATIAYNAIIKRAPSLASLTPGVLTAKPLWLSGQPASDALTSSRPARMAITAI